MNITTTIKQCMQYLYTAILYIICPPQCYSCKKYTPTRVILCATCEQNLEFIAPKLFKINESYFLTVYTVTRYTEPLRPMLFAKYRSDPAVLHKVAELMWTHSALKNIEIDYLIPIPLHWTRNISRGFNQAEILADCLSKYSHIPVCHALQRSRRTEFQIHVQHSDRQINVKNAFELCCNIPDLKNKHIMLVDDSCTTGSTAIEAAKVLIALVPASINMIVACRAL